MIPLSHFDKRLGDALIPVYVSSKVGTRSAAIGAWVQPNDGASSCLGQARHQGPRPHAVSRLRFQASQRRPRHPCVPGLPRPSPVACLSSTSTVMMDIAVWPSSKTSMAVCRGPSPSLQAAMAPASICTSSWAIMRCATAPAFVPRGASVDGAPTTLACCGDAVVLRHMRRNVDGAHRTIGPRVPAATANMDDESGRTSP